MAASKRCGTGNVQNSGNNYEIIYLEKTENICPICEDYARKQSEKPVAVICCEGACLRGEIARRAANMVCLSMPGKTARICLGGAFTKDTGQRSLVRNAKKVIALEGCFIKCSSRMMKGAIPGLKPKVIVADELYDFDRNLFGINEMAEKDINSHAQNVADKVAKML